MVASNAPWYNAKVIVLFSFSSSFSSSFFSSLSFAYSLVQQSAYDQNFRSLASHIFGYVSVRAVELLMQVIWLLKFL